MNLSCSSHTCFAYLRWLTRRLHLLNSFHGTRRNRRTKFGIAFTTLLLVMMTGYKTNVTGNDNNSNNLVKCPQHVETQTSLFFPVNVPSPCASSTDDDRCPIILLILHRFPALASAGHQTAQEVSTLVIWICGRVVKVGWGDSLAGRADATKNARADGPGER